MSDTATAMRRNLLNDPRLQLPRITAESAARTDLVKAQLSRQHLRVETVSERDCVTSLHIRCRIERVSTTEKLDRISELFQHTTQFNTNGRKFAVSELEVLVVDADARVFSIEVRDRFGDQGWSVRR